jgi:hypothetical protein
MNKEILSKWHGLSDYFPYPIEESDLQELAKFITYRTVD